MKTLPNNGPMICLIGIRFVHRSLLDNLLDALSKRDSITKFIIFPIFQIQPKEYTTIEGRKILKGADVIIVE